MKRIALILLLAGCLWAQPDHEDETKTSEALAICLEKNATARGGRGALDRLHTVWVKINERAYLVRKNPHYLIVLVLNEDGGVAYAEGFDGEVSWEQIGEGPRYETSGRPRVALWHTTQIPSPLNALYRMPAKGHRLRYLGLEALEGQTYHRILLTLSDGWETSYYVNAQTYRMERSRNVRRFHAVDAHIREIETIWSNFKEVDGITIPFGIREIDLETGEQLSKRETVLGVRLNVAIPNETFALTGDHRAVVAIDPSRQK